MYDLSLFVCVGIKVRGHMTVDRVIVERGICPNSEEGFTHMMCLSEDGESKDVKARSAKTEIVVLQRGFYDGDPATKLRLLPFTGEFDSRLLIS